MAERDFFIRLSLKDADVVKRALEGLGKDGQAALNRIADTAQPASMRLRLVNTAAEEGQNVMRGYAAQLGPVGNALGMLGTRGLVAAAGISAVALAIGKGLAVNRELETLKASLETVTGSATAAKAAFDQITAFTTTTPFTLDQVAAAFIKLKALGLDPSEAALRSYGNTASAMGKSLDQMIEAIADATTGEFERLKEFGIRASSEGSRVTFTFRGISTTIQKEAAAIQGYLRELGDVQFAGGMERQAKTLNTQISNLTDAWRLLLAEMATFSGARAATGGVVEWLTDLANRSRRGLESTSDLSRQIATIGREIASAEDALAQMTSRGMKPEDARVQEGTRTLGRLRREQELLIAKASAEGEAVAADAARTKAEADAQAAAKAEARADAIAKLTAEQAREIELARMNADLRAQQSAADKAEADLRKEVADATEAEVAAARARAIEAVRTQQAVSAAASAGSKAETAAAREAKKAAEDWLKVIGTVNAEQRKSTEAKAEAHADIAEQIKGIEEETRQLGLSNVEREIAVELIRAEARAKRDNTSVTDEERAAIESATRARVAERERLEQQKQARDQAARDAQKTTDDVVDYAGDTFADFFSDTPKSWKEMWEDMRSTAMQTLAKLGADLVLRPVIQPIVNAVYGNQGVGGVPGLGGVTGTGGTAGGGFNLSSVSDIGRIFSMGGGSLSPGLDAFAQGALGFGQMSNFAGAPAGAIGPFLPGANAGLLNGGLGGATAGFASLSNVLGIAGAVLPGLISGNYAQAAAGGIGAAIGTVLLPGIGTALGGMFGNLVGGLFGKGSKDELKILSASNRQGNAVLGDTFDDNLALKSPFGYVGLSDNKTSGYDAGFVANMVKALQRSDRGVAQYMSGTEISTVSNVLQTTGGYSRRDREFDEEEFGKVIRGRLRPILEALDINQQLVEATLAGTDAEELQQAAQELLARRQAIRDIIDYSGEEGEIRKAERSAFDQLASAIDELSLANEDFGFSATKAAEAQKRLVEQYLGIGETVEPMTAAEKALAAMNERIEQTAALAKQVGITLTPAEIEAQLREQLRTGFDEGIADQIKAITDPLGFALEQFDEAAAARLEEAKLLGGNLVEVERLNALERAKVIEQYGAQSTNRLREWLNQQSLGSLSSLSPDKQIIEARRQFDTAIGSRDFEAITGAADSYLGIAQNFYASSAQYAAIERFVRGQVEGLLGDGGGTLAASDMGAAMFGGGGSADAATPAPAPAPTASARSSDNVVAELRKQVAELQRIVMVLQAGFQLVEAQGADASTQRTDTNRHLRRLVDVKA